MHKAVSIIIPVYNGEKYLVECLGNVVGQTLEETEIILVNDASEDQSLFIMQECRRQFPEKVTVIDLEKNLGAGGARNAGIELAQGEYLGFVDCDDLVDIHMYEKLYRKACTGDYDIVDCGYYKQADDLAIIHTTDEMTGILDNKKRSAMIAGGGYIVSKIFHRRMFADKELRFRNHVILEDSDFLNYAFAVAHRMGNVKEILYYYRDIAGSSSDTRDIEKYYRNIYEAIQAIYKKMHRLDTYSELRDAVEYEMLQMYSYGINMCLKGYLEGTEADYPGKLKALGELKERTVRGDYTNPYVKAKIQETDIRMMQLNDSNPEALLKYIMGIGKGRKSER